MNRIRCELVLTYITSAQWHLHHYRNWGLASAELDKIRDVVLDELRHASDLAMLDEAEAHEVLDGGAA